MSDQVYCYPPEYIVLKNKLNFKDDAMLEMAERRLVSVRQSQGCPTGNFDLNHLKSIHHHLFQDVYDWAGEIRTLEISKGGSQFLPRQFIETGMNDVYNRLESTDCLRDLDAKKFSMLAGELLGDINHIHPFREGNGRTQLQYLSQLSEQAGHDIDLTKLDAEKWMNASIRSHHGDYEAMQDSIYTAVAFEQDHESETDKKREAEHTSQDRFSKAYKEARQATLEHDQENDHELE